MNDMNQFMTNELVTGKSASKIQKIIFDIIFQHIHDMVFVMKVESGPIFRYLFINEAGMSKANLSTEVIGKSFQEALPRNRASILQRKYEKLLKNEKVTKFDDHFFYNGEYEVYGETILTPIFNELNEISYVVGVTRDITERILEKKKMARNEQRYRSIVDNNLDAIFSITPMGKILEVNPAAAMLTGYSEKQMTSRSIYDLIHDTDLDKIKSMIEKTCTGHPLESLDCKIIHSKGQQLIVHIKTAPIVIHGEIDGLFVILKDLSEHAKNMEMIRFMAFHDQLTGLFNRRALLDHLNAQMDSPAKKSQEFALISIDLDRFKHLNDTLGHLAGDEILKGVAVRLSQFQNNQCLLYRIGGDEFSILLLNTNRQAASRFVSKVFHLFSQSFYFNSQEYFISPSIGVSMYPLDGKDAEMLIKNADEALFQVKERGKAHYQFYRTDMKSVFTNVVTLETQLRKAMEKQELSLFYQPQVTVMNEKVKSFEALLRWKNKDFGYIPPSVFIPLAEDTGLIISIGYWVIEQACGQIKRWNEKGYSDIRVAVNISPKQFQQSNLVPFIEWAIKNYQISPASLEIEITEGAMSDTSETIPILNKLKRLGISIAVDDFGTGYSSLSYLKQFPIDGLKIDQSFIRDILTDEKDAAITTTIIHLGKSLGLEVIAEGVENQQQKDLLLKAGCHKIQGYYYSKPIPENELESLFLMPQ